MSELYLIGTLPYDSRGRERLRGLLTALSPSTIGMQDTMDRGSGNILRPYLESPEIEKQIEKHWLRFARKAGLRLNLQQEDTYVQAVKQSLQVMGYDSEIAEDYARASGAEVVYMGIHRMQTAQAQLARIFALSMMNILKTVVDDPGARREFLAELDKGPDSFIEYSSETSDLIYEDAEEIGSVLSLGKEADYIRDFLVDKEMLDEFLLFQSVGLGQIYDPQEDKVIASRIKDISEREGRKAAIIRVGYLHPVAYIIRDLMPEIITLNQWTSYTS